MTTHSNGSHVAVPAGSAIYVDTENLRESDHAQTVVAQVVANWPADRPPLSGLSLYVRADKAELWQLWAETEFPALQVRVRGVQHFSNHRAKNSADLAITADAIADLITGLAGAVGVVSNDSDFGALFVKVRELAAQADTPEHSVPVDHRSRRRNSIRRDRAVHSRTDIVGTCPRPWRRRPPRLPRL